MSEHLVAKFDVSVALARRQRNGLAGAIAIESVQYLRIMQQMIADDGVDVDHYRVVIEAVPTGETSTFDPPVFAKRRG